MPTNQRNEYLRDCRVGINDKLGKQSFRSKKNEELFSINYAWLFIVHRSVLLLNNVKS